MPDFFSPHRELTIADIVSLTGAKPRPDTPLDRGISDIAPLDRARATDITFLDNAKYLAALTTTGAGVCLAPPRFAAQAPERLAVLIAPEPYRAFVTVARALFPAALRPSSLFETTGRSADARIHPSARLETGVTVDPLAVIGPEAEIGSGTLIGPGAVIGPAVAIGRDSAVGAGATIVHALIGDRVIIHPGARIGQDGFGYLPSPRGHQKIPQTRRVIIQDDVEIGANTTIDRGSTRDTVIGEGTKIDNLVQIAHNVSIGRHCLIAGQTGVSGSSQVGDFVMMGGQVGLADHVNVGSGAMLGAQSGYMSDIPPGTRFPHINGFFSKDLAEVREDPSGWIFARGGDALIACRPLQPYTWKPIEGGGRRLFSPYLKNGMVVQVASRSEYSDLDAFRRAILALPLEFHLAPLPSVRFRSLRGKQLAFTYGQVLDYTNWPLFGGPFVEAAVDSEQLILKYGTMRRTLDFRRLTVTDTP